MFLRLTPHDATQFLGARSENTPSPYRERQRPVRNLESAEGERSEFVRMVENCSMFVEQKLRVRTKWYSFLHPQPWVEFAMSQPTQPSDVYKAFTWPRLIALAKILFDTREWVANDARPDRGDGLCGIGFRAWEQSKFFVSKAAATELSDWLSIADAGSEFKFRLDMMPIRFCRGDSEQPLPPNYATADARERAETELAFDLCGQPAFNGVFRFLVEADRRGAPLAVYLVQANEQGETVRMWRIPREGDAGGVAPIVVPQTPVVLPALTVETLEEAAERERIEREQADKAAAAKGTVARGPTLHRGA